MADADPEEERGEKFMNETDYFRRNAYFIIEEMVALNAEAASNHPELVDEVLHCIFFLGQIYNPLKYLPEHIVNDAGMLNALRHYYPHPFECYSTQLPKRDPMSCVLEMIVNVTGQENEKGIYESLLTLMDELKEGPTNQLVSSTFCVSQHNICENPARYYGVSMSSFGRNPGRIMVAASCLNYWHSHVAGAVMTYSLDTRIQIRNPDFDGTIRIPEEVRCQAFSLSRNQETTEMNACRSCGELFGLTPSDATGWRYGNCAEPESLSNLFRNEEAVRVRIRTLPRDEGRERARQSILTELRGILRRVRFTWHEQFYTPQVRS